MENLTINYLTTIAHQSSISQAIEQAKEYYGIYPRFTSKRPQLPRNADSTQVKEYLTLLESYETLKKEYDDSVIAYKTNTHKVNTIIENFIKEESGLSTIVPEQYRDKLYSYAYSKGHSYGYYEIFIYLIDLIEIFK